MFVSSSQVFQCELKRSYHLLLYVYKKLTVFFRYSYKHVVDGVIRISQEGNGIVFLSATHTLAIEYALSGVVFLITRELFQSVEWSVHGHFQSYSDDSFSS